MPQFDMKDLQHLLITTDTQSIDRREIIIDKEKDVRICDGHHVIKIRFSEHRIRDVLVDDVFVWTW